MIIGHHFVLGLILAPPAAAQTWTAAVGTNWNTAGNWTPHRSTELSHRRRRLRPAGAVAVNISASVQARSLTFDDIGARTYTLTSAAGQTLTGVTEINAIGAVTAAETINLANVANASLPVPGTGAAALLIDNGGRSAGARGW